MREETGDVWTWDDGEVAARVVTREQAYEKFGQPLQEMVEAYDSRYGELLHAFKPMPENDRDYWLLVLPPSDSDARRAAEQIRVWTWVMLDEGTVVMPYADIADVLDGPALFSDGLRSIGDRFVGVHP